MMCLSGVGHRRWCRALSERRDPPRSSSDDLADDLHHPPRRTGGEHEAVAALVDEARVVEPAGSLRHAARVANTKPSLLLWMRPALLSSLMASTTPPGSPRSRPMSSMLHIGRSSPVSR